MALEKRIKSLMKNKESKPLVKVESPLFWLKTCIVFSSFSLLASLAYLIINSLEIITDLPLINNTSLIIFTVGFFLVAIVHLVRTGVFMVDPTSKTNIFAGKVVYFGIEVGFRIVLLAFVGFMQFANLLMFDILIQQVTTQPILLIYAITIILSFIGMLPIIHGILFRLTKQARRSDWIGFFLFSAPWIFLIISSILIWAGIKVF